MEKMLLELQPRLFSFAMKLTGHKDRALDLLQETSLRALTYKTQYKEGTKARSWIFTIMKNTFINTWRSNNRKNTLNDNINEKCLLIKETDDSTTPESFLTVKEINDSINDLSLIHKTPFELMIKGFAYDEIAEILNIPMGTVKTRIFYARKYLMENIERY